MEVAYKFSDIYELAEKHDIVGFNRAVYWLLLNMSRRDIEMITNEIYNDFLDSRHCIECDNQQYTKIDQMLMDGEIIYSKVCPDCGTEIELDI